MMGYFHKLKYLFMGDSNKVPAEISHDLILHVAATTYGGGWAAARKMTWRAINFMNVANLAQNEAQSHVQAEGDAAAQLSKDLR